MEATTLTSVQLEGLLGYARAELLRLAGEQGEDNGEIDDDIVAFACALARQCFINEYVYAQTEAESGLASVLRDRLLQDLASGTAHNATHAGGSRGLFPASCHADGGSAAAAGLASDRGRPVTGAAPRTA